MPKIVDKILRAGEGRVLRELEGIAKQVNAIEEDFMALTDEELRGQTDLFKERLAQGETLDSLLPEAFAAVREASRRTLGKRHFDVQIMGGAALHKGNVAEMKTGEGKTLVATLPSYLNALTGKGVHVITVNDYLAQYQAELMGRVHRMLGLETGVILANMTPDERRREYAKDITYGTNNEFGFDYLRDNMAWQTNELVQRGHHFAIVDEVDSILIDEARTPLIISGPADGTTKWYTTMAQLVKHLERGHGEDKLKGIKAQGDYEVDEKKKTVGILEPGIEKVEDYLGIDNLYTADNTPLVSYINNAIKAKELFKRDKDYVVMDGEVLIVDEHTGRILAGRRYNEGMHQAIEAKEGVKIQSENQTLATITLQNYFRLYDKLSGMTGTAQTEAAELHQIYKVGVVPIPTNKDMIRQDQADLVYRTEEAKFDALVQDIAERHRRGQPVLVGTTSVEKSEHLSHKLQKLKVPHAVLNAKHHESEATIVAEAGRKGAVTVATNMAGRGTDIMLGGNPEFRAVEALKRRGLSPEETPEEYEAAWEKALQDAEEAVKAEHDEVEQLGGLYVLGTERHESRRIDNQLRGRSGRQGNPGESRFYLSLEDELMRMFNSEMVNRFMVAAQMDDSVPIEHKIVTKSIQSAQTQVEGRNFDIRKNVLKYDDVLNNQRKVIYGERRRVLEGEDVHEQVRHFVNDTISEMVRQATLDQLPEDWDLEGLWTALAEIYPVTVKIQDLENAVGGRSSLTREILLQELTSDAQYALDAREEQFGKRALREVERRVVLSVLDRKWREHLYEMDYLKEGIGLRAMAQRDPVVEYSREGFQMFQAMVEGIKEDAARLLLNGEIHVDHSQLPPEEDEETAETEGAEERVEAEVTATANPEPTEAPESAAGEPESASQRRGEETPVAAEKSQERPPRDIPEDAVRGEGVEHPHRHRYSYSGGGDTTGEVKLNRQQRREQKRRQKRRG